jgi:hypothetical protein
MAANHMLRTPHKCHSWSPAQLAIIKQYEERVVAVREIAQHNRFSLSYICPYGIGVPILCAAIAEYHSSAAEINVIIFSYKSADWICKCLNEYKHLYKVSKHCYKNRKTNAKIQVHVYAGKLWTYTCDILIIDFMLVNGCAYGLRTLQQRITATDHSVLLITDPLQLTGYTFNWNRTHHDTQFHWN